MEVGSIVNSSSREIERNVEWQAPGDRHVIERYPNLRSRDVVCRPWIWCLAWVFRSRFRGRLLLSLENSGPYHRLHNDCERTAPSAASAGSGTKCKSTRQSTHDLMLAAEV